jgi:uncharacterized membrane protein
MKSKFSAGLLQNLDLLILFGATVLALPLMSFDSGPARAILGIIFLFLTPGYVFVSALFPGIRPLSSLERLVCSLVASIAVVCLTGVVLSFTPIGVNLQVSLIIISAFDLIFLLVALVRRLKLPDSERFSLATDRFRELFLQCRPNVIAITLAIIIIAGVVAGSIFAVNHSVTKAQDEFYLLPVEGNTYNHSRIIQIGENLPVRVVVVNHSSNPQSYRMDIVIAGAVLRSYDKIDLKSGETWNEVIKVQPVKTGDNQRIEYVLTGSNIKDTLYTYVDVHEK